MTILAPFIIKPNDFVYCASEVDFLKDLGTIEVLQLLIKTLRQNKTMCQLERCPIIQVLTIFGTVMLFLYGMQCEMIYNIMLLPK